MSKINFLGTGNIAFSGNEIYSTNGNDVLIGNNLIPIANTFSIGSSANPINDVYVSANSLFLAPFTPGNPPLALTNDNNNFNVVNAGLRSTVIYTGGLLLSGNNIGADPFASNQPMTIGTNNLPAVTFLCPISAISNTNIANLTASNIVTNSALIGKDFSNFTVVSTVTNTTAVSADFSKDTLIHLHAYKNGTINSVSSPLKITPINFTAGSTVDILIFNPLPSNGVVYMDWGGVNANFLNYQNNSYAPYIVALSSISPSQTYHFKYICIDGTLANTFITA